MKRSLMVLAFFSAFLVVSAAVYALPPEGQAWPTFPTNVTSAGSLALSEESMSVAAANTDAQQLVGQTVDQLQTEMGTPNGVLTDSSGDKTYLYKIPLTATIADAHILNQFFDVSADGKVTGESSVAD